ncbi:hypothetical protein D6D02_08965 [Aureobasidium pullulans]|uniref:Uncharacterized protein n=1 Tax=Aureobasidium pullulans TaxID=5580 RepID=A0A4S9JGD2_AURPU|nr:hypothetical protein D6D20_09574 [Aureobasidium pullulans]THY00229.1 hypothetical protein D6D02_08965 [Aureobasidium pullulans]
MSTNLRPNSSFKMLSAISQQRPVSAPSNPDTQMMGAKSAENTTMTATARFKRLTPKQTASHKHRIRGNSTSRRTSRAVRTRYQNIVSSIMSPLPHQHSVFATADSPNTDVDLEKMVAKFAELTITPAPNRFERFNELPSELRLSIYHFAFESVSSELRHESTVSLLPRMMPRMRDMVLTLDKPSPSQDWAVKLEPWTGSVWEPWLAHNPPPTLCLNWSWENFLRSKTAMDHLQNINTLKWKCEGKGFIVAFEYDIIARVNNPGNIPVENYQVSFGGTIYELETGPSVPMTMDQRGRLIWLLLDAKQAVCSMHILNELKKI